MRGSTIIKLNRDRVFWHGCLASGYRFFLINRNSGTWTMTLSIEWVNTVILLSGSIQLNGSVYPHIDNGVFLDGRDKTLKEHGMELHKQIESGVEVMVVKHVKDKRYTNKAT